MIKKTIIISLIALLFCAILIPSTLFVVAKKDVKTTAGMASYLDINWTSYNEPIVPVKDIRYYNINITYGISRGIALRNIFFPLLKDMQVIINLEIADKPDWCSATFMTNTLTTKVSDQEQQMSTKLAVQLDKDAPAYARGYVKFNASIAPIKGPLGLITFIDGFKEDYTIEFVPAYIGSITAEFPQGDSIEISPYNVTNIPIDVANLGNGLTNVDFEIVNSSKSFNVSIDKEILIDVNGKATAYLIIIADHRFDIGEIKIKLTPRYAYNPTDEGQPIYLTLSVKNDGSYIEEEPGSQIDSTMVIAILLIIAIIVIAIILLKRRK